MITRYGPADGLSVVWMGRRTAEEHTRHVYNVKPETGLGWKPYTIIIESGALAHTAFHTAQELRRWLGGGFKIRLGSHWRRPGIRCGVVVAR